MVSIGYHGLPAEFSVAGTGGTFDNRGRIPFNGKKLYHVRDAEPLSKFHTTADRAVERLLARAMSKEPGKRQQTAAEFADDIEKTLNGGGTRDAKGESLGGRWARGLFGKKSPTDKH
jgi:hypothetical protein